MTMRISLSAAAMLALLPALAACDRGRDQVAELDRELVGNSGEADPALTSALEDQIMVDPALAQQGADRKPGTAPAQAPIPPGANPGAGPTLGELARGQGAARTGGVKKGCYDNLRYSADWANRLPAELPLFPDAQVSEAAGNPAPECNVRIVSFSSASPPQKLVDWYAARARKAGYSAEHQVSDGGHVLGGVRERDDGAFYLSLSPRSGGGTEGDLVANNGR